MPASIDHRDIGSAAAGSSIPTVILAGGRARRMGGADKVTLDLGGHAVLTHILRALERQAGPSRAAPIALNANGGAGRFAAFGLPVLPDPVPGQPGPLAGILAAMIWAAPFSDRVLSWPGDTPHPPSDLLARLTAAPTTGIICASSHGRLHPVIGLWPVGLADRLRTFLRSGEHRVRTFATATGLTAIAWDTDPDPFTNLNTPGDLEAAAARLRGAAEPAVEQG